MKSFVPITFLLIALAILAGLQYRWINEFSQAQRQQLENGLRDSSERFARDFAEELTRIPRLFERLGPFDGDATVLMDRYRDWKSGTSHPGLIRHVYAMKAHPGEAPAFYNVNLETGAAEPATILGPISFPEYLAIPGALFELDVAVLRNEVFPALAANHFPKIGDQDYRIAVVKTGPPAEVLYSTGNAWSADDVAHADYSVPLLGGPPGGPRGGQIRGGDPFGNGPFRGGPPGNFRGGQPPGAGFPRGEFPGFPGDRGRGARGSPPPPPPIVREFAGGGALRLLVRHEAGSLEQAVTQIRRRNLAVSFGILLVLAGAALTLLVSSHRARTLGRMQVEFAASVSHELRTPLAVIQSAAHNLRTGVVREPQAIEQYAGMMQDEARRLSDMVEQVMAYAESQSGKRRFDLSAVDVRDVIDQAVKSVPAIEGVAVNIEQRIENDIPTVLADPMALFRCLQNLISNSLKYGGRDNQVQIEIEASRTQDSSRVRLSVMDSGSGIPAADIPHLFEAFHRGSMAGAATPGNGLGLHLVRKTMEAHNGAVEFRNRPQGGASFTLIVPAVKSEA